MKKVFAKALNNVVVLDLEATCWDKEANISRDDMEIIEIGAVWMEKGEVKETFKTLIKPTLHDGVLSEFCTNLTGITQDELNANGVSYVEAIKAFEQWLGVCSRKYGKLDAWASWGNYDKNQFERDCKRHNKSLSLLKFAHKNAKDYFFAYTPSFKGSAGMAKVAGFLKIKLEGKLHRALDDALNICKIINKCKMNFAKTTEQIEKENQKHKPKTKPVGKKPVGNKNPKQNKPKATRKPTNPKPAEKQE